MKDASTITSPDYNYQYSYDKSKRIFGLGSYDPKYYDQIVTKLNVQAVGQQHKSLLRDQAGISGKRVLLVDDEPDICMVYQMVLEEAGYQCISYTDPVQALQEFKPNYYDLIILDIKMPVLNGFELCKKIREIDKAVHIIFITAAEEYYEKFRHQRFIELGKVNYIQKPIGNDELVRLVDMIITITIINDFTSNSSKTS